MTRGSQLCTPVPVEDVRLGGVVVASLHERPLDQVLDLLDLGCAVGREGLLHPYEQRFEDVLVMRGWVGYLCQGLVHGTGDFLPVVGLCSAVSLGNLHVDPILRRGSRLCVSWATGGELGARCLHSEHG